MVESRMLGNSPKEFKRLEKQETVDLHEINSRMGTDLNEHAKEIGAKSEIGTRENPRYIIARNEYLDGDEHPITGVRFEKKTVELPNGEYIEGVFPKFDSKFNAEIPKELYLSSDKAQFKECNKQLLSKIEGDQTYAKQFSKDQIEQIKEGTLDGSAPDGYVWHHEPDSGKISLVDSTVHSQTGHTGGRSLWGGGSENR